MNPPGTENTELFVLKVPELKPSQNVNKIDKTSILSHLREALPLAWREEYSWGAQGVERENVGKGRQMLDQGESWGFSNKCGFSWGGGGEVLGAGLHLSKQEGVIIIFYSKSIRMEGGKFEKAMKFESHVPNEK